MALHYPGSSPKISRESGDLTRGAIVIYQWKIGLCYRQDFFGYKSLFTAAGTENSLATVEKYQETAVIVCERLLDSVPPERLYVLRLVTKQYVIPLL